MKRLLFLSLALWIGLSSYAQRNCETMEVLEQMQLEDPFLEERMDQIEEFTKNYLQGNKEAVSGVVSIPVVVHVVYNRRRASENISLAQINSQIQVLNDDFRRLNSDANNTWSQASDVEIEFCLASIDPSGNVTTGITRTQSRKNSFGTNNSIKFNSQGGKNAWPASDYLNIWVGNIGGGILGYAQFPGGGASTDGVVVDYRYFGTTGTATFPFNLGRTCTHEVGHWLNLRHIWGDGPCGVDDFVNDTPESDAPNYGCATGHVSCSSLDMVENYMDYSDDVCMNLFTADQKDRMRALFDVGGFRSSLLNSNGCGGGVATPTCNDGIQNQGETGIDCGGPCAACPPTGACTDPTGLSSTSRKGGREAQLSWNAVASANSYTVGLRPAGASTWSTTSASNTTIRATNLSKGSTYEWFVQADCGGGTTSNQVTSSFVAGQSNRISDIHDFVVFPNPATDLVNIQFYSENNHDVKIVVRDVSGRLVKVDNQQALIGNNHLHLDLSALTSGLYLIDITLENGETITQKISKN